MKIFTDGSCLGNPGPGGYAALLRYGKHEKIVQAGYYLTTNNRMELLAAIVALEQLKRPCKVDLTTDSQYVYLGITKWIHNWKQHGWKKSNRILLPNTDLWQRLELACATHEMHWYWIRGHNGHVENERCDRIAHQAAAQPTLVDEGYIK